MNRIRMLLVEELVTSDSGEFMVEAPTAEAAAAILLDAHGAARDRDSNTVTLPDGQSRVIDPEDHVERSDVFCILLDDTGNEVRRVDPGHGDPNASDGAQKTIDRWTEQTDLAPPGSTAWAPSARGWLTRPGRRLSLGFYIRHRNQDDIGSPALPGQGPVLGIVVTEAAPCPTRCFADVAAAKAWIEEQTSAVLTERDAA